MRRAGVLTGLAAEARIVEKISRTLPAPPLIACAGADAARARERARGLAAEGAGLLLSFGLAGGLDPRLAAGDIVLADGVISPEGGFAAAAEGPRGRLRALGEEGRLRIFGGAIAAAESPVAAVEDKRALAERTGAVATDMESLAVAGAAGEAGLPFLLVRAVADTAGQGLPPAARAAVDARGRVRAMKVAGILCRAPRQAGELLRLGRSARAGLAALERLARLAGPALFSAGAPGD